MSEYRIHSTALSSGAAFGPVILMNKEEAVAERKDLGADERGAEKTLLGRALALSLKEIRETAVRVEAELGRDKAEIFEGHAEILADGEFQDDFLALVENEGYCAAFAVRTVCERHALEMEELEDEYFRLRADDFRDIGRRVISRIAALASGSPCANESCAPPVFPPSPSIVVSKSLSPGETVQFHAANVLGFVVCSGGLNSHAAILARSLGIPAALIAEEELIRLAPGTLLALNLEKDTVIVGAGKETKARAEAAKEAEEARKKKLALLRDLSAQTLCGKKISLYANGGGMKDLAGITASNADGIGLFRTEFLFMEQTSFPDEETQTVFYRRVLETMKGRPVIFRLLDIGGDKPLPYAPHPAETNPFLGWRGIRFLLDNPLILRAQLRSLLKASSLSGYPVRIMVPMVARPDEVRAVKEMIDEEIKVTGGNAVLGMMVETPAAAMTVAAYKGLISFISVGSNDLTQYTLAADRENGHLGPLYSEFHPGVLALMKKACADAREEGMETGICGEFAGNPEGALYLAAMGFDELSMSASALAPVKEMIRGITLDEARACLDKALGMGEASLIREYARDFLEKKGMGR